MNVSRKKKDSISLSKIQGHKNENKTIRIKFYEDISKLKILKKLEN